MKLNWFYALIAVLFCALIFVTIKFFKGSGHSSVGIAVSNTYKVSSDRPALISAVKVTSGQQIQAGQLLVELSSVDLEMEVEKLENKISVLKMEQLEKSKLAYSEVALVKAQTGVKIEEINTEIAEAESSLKLNRELTRSHDIKLEVTAESPIDEKIKALKVQRSKHEEASAIQVRDIMQESETEQLLLGNQVKLLQKELDLLYAQKKELNKYASSPGVVESVFVKPGEQIDAFTALVSLNPVHPTSVVGYLVGKKEAMPVGSPVNISSYENPGNLSEGKIIGYGAVVELPEILQKATATKAFGREVFIEIGPGNLFSAGEKVLIR